MLLKFYHDSLQYFLFQSRIYIFRVIWNRIWIFYISYLWSLSYRDFQSKSWMSNLMDSSFTRYFVSIFRMEYIYLIEWFRKWWIFYISYLWSILSWFSIEILDVESLMNSSFTEYFISIFKVEYIYIYIWPRYIWKWWIFYISWSLSYRDSQSKSWPALSRMWLRQCWTFRTVNFCIYISLHKSSSANKGISYASVIYKVCPG